MENKTLKEIFETIEKVDENRNCHFDMEELADMFTEVDKKLRALKIIKKFVNIDMLMFKGELEQEEYNLLREVFNDSRA